MRVWIARLGALFALVVMTGGVGTAYAAPSSTVVISQVYGGGGNAGATYTNDFVELFNRGGTAVNLNGWSVQYASSAGTSWQRTALTNVTLQPGQYYLVQQAAGAGGTQPLPTPDATGGIPMSATAGKVALTSTGDLLTGACPTANVVDFVGFGSGANCSETAPTATLSNTTAALRRGGGCTETDDNGADFATGAPTPRNTAAARNVCDAPTGTGAATPATVSAGAGALLTVTVKPAATPPSTGITVRADLSSIGGSASQALFDDGTNGDVTAGDSVFSYRATVPAAAAAGSRTLPVAIADAEGRTGSTTIGLTVADACGDARRPVSQVQGSGATSPIAGQSVTVEGVVTRSYQGAGEFGGFYLQDPSPDEDPATSEGLFVFSTARTVAAGDVVRVRGRAAEFTSGSSSLTQLTDVDYVLLCGTGVTVAPTEVALPVASLSDFERYEGMLVRFTQTLTVTETFTLGRFGEVRLAAGGRLYTPTAVTTPGTAAQALADANLRRSFVLDDGNNQQNIDPVRYPQGGLSATNTLRSGSTVDPGLVGIFDERFSTYRVQPAGAVAFNPSNPRTTAPDPVGGNVKVASFNVLNLFNGNGTLQEGAAGGFPTSRGANTLFEFNRQLAKEVSALKAIDADVVGLMEIENDAGPNSALATLVNALNAAVGAGTYAYLETGEIGTDEIKVALIYKPAKVRPVGDFKLLTSAVDPRFVDTLNRPVLAQSFEPTGNLERFTVAVNHLKSKGSACTGDPDTGDGQGNCNLTRTNAARAELDWLATDPTGSGTSDVLVIGDMNAYTFEDPIRVFTAAEYVNLILRFGGPAAYSYVFDGQAGYLDHALASKSLAPKVTGATDWHINADEPIVLDYNVEFKTPGQVDAFYDPGPYRSSDHDPVIVGLNLRRVKVDETTTIGGSVPATLGLTLGPAASFGPFQPGVANTYRASTTATVVSTAGDARLSVTDPSSTAPGRLVNGAFALPQPLRAAATSPAGASAGDGAVSGSPLALLNWAAPVSNDPVAIEFAQTIASTDPLRTGTYGKTLTFTLSTTTP